MKTAVIPALCGKEEDRGIALAQWQAQLRRFCLFVEHSDEFTLSEFVKKVDEIMPELRRAAMSRSSPDRNRIELESADHPLAVERTHGHRAQARRTGCCFDDARQQQALRPKICLKLGELGPSPVESSYRNVWSAAELQAKNEQWQLVCVNVFGL